MGVRWEARMDETNEPRQEERCRFDAMALAFVAGFVGTIALLYGLVWLACWLLSQRIVVL